MVCSDPHGIAFNQKSNGHYSGHQTTSKLVTPSSRVNRRFRPLGSPTVRDRVVQCAVKNILELICEAATTLEDIWMCRRRQKMAGVRGHPTDGSSKGRSASANTAKNFSVPDPCQ